MAVTTGFQGRTFDVPRTCVLCIDPPRRAPCAAADAVFADAKAFLSSSEARQMSESELERELHRRGGHDGLHRLDAALNLLPERYLVEMRRRVLPIARKRAFLHRHRPVSLTR